MKVIKQETYIIPSHYITALYYGDYSGLTDDEVTAFDTWLDKREPQFDIAHHSDDSFFAYRNDIDSLGSDCHEVTLVWLGE